jgi:hypothetical protein
MSLQLASQRGRVGGGQIQLRILPQITQVITLNRSSTLSRPLILHFLKRVSSLAELCYQAIADNPIAVQSSSKDAEEEDASSRAESSRMGRAALKRKRARVATDDEDDEYVPEAHAHARSHQPHTLGNAPSQHAQGGNQSAMAVGQSLGPSSSTKWISKSGKPL